ncbi:arsenic resistance N-acetyltransferase ArsN2 [Halorussus litoreus]|uniref:arsenic resistance N-acetyltransferase ArsN2 n=1 Tax=Halorussus litoreus TaxID=1710536 RepID=UPI000E27EDF7|nr:arsenic resistance N-acetyltransferase ArsN2 [Halorussus litoreus]
MTTDSITLREADDADLDRIEALLADNELPTRDVRTTEAQFFLAYDGVDDDCAVDDAKLIGTGGVETYDSNGVLRSVVVTEPNRDRGYGAALCDALEDAARASGVETLYLLTTTAADFFDRRGYEEIARKNAPTDVRESAEFAKLCPSSATCMRKEIR